MGRSRTGDQCVEDQSKLPKVDRGAYTAQLSLKNAHKAVSDPVTIRCSDGQVRRRPLSGAARRGLGGCRVRPQRAACRACDVCCADG